MRKNDLSSDIIPLYLSVLSDGKNMDKGDVVPDGAFVSDVSSDKLISESSITTVSSTSEYGHSCIGNS